MAAADPYDVVKPGDGGLSTAPDDPMLLPQFRRPPSLGGTSKHPVWSIMREVLAGHGLSHRRDGPSHEVVEPSDQTTLADFESRLQQTALRWSVSHE